MHTSATPPSRRAVLGAAAWAAPVIVVAAGAPAFAASGATSLTPTTPVSRSFSEDTAATRTVVATLRGATAPVAGATVRFVLSSTSWLTLAGTSTATSTTDAAGAASAVLTALPGATPAPGDTATLTATHEGLSTSWTVTYRPFTLLATGAAAAHVLAVADAQPYAWGVGSNGQLGSPGNSFASPVALATADSDLVGRPITALAVGGSFSLALSLGRVHAWGQGNNGQRGDGDSATLARIAPREVNTDESPMNGKDIVAVAAGQTFALALDTAGAVYSWGLGGGGQRGDGTNDQVRDRPVAVVTAGTPMADKRIVAIVAGSLHALALDSDGLVYSWGSNSGGALGDGTTPNSYNLPRAVHRTQGSLVGKTVVALAAGNAHSLAVDSEGRVHAWGLGTSGQRGDGTTNQNRSVPALVSDAGTPMSGKRIVGVWAGNGLSVALDSDNALYTWGSGQFGQLGNGTLTAAQTKPVAVTTSGTPLEGRTIAAVSTTGYQVYVLTADRLVLAWGDRSFRGLLGDGVTSGSQSTAVRVKVVP